MGKKLGEAGRQLRMLETHVVPENTPDRWAVVMQYALKWRGQIEEADGLANAYRAICERRGGRPLNRRWLASVLAVCAAKRITVAGHVCREVQPGVVRVERKVDGATG